MPADTLQDIQIKVRRLTRSMSEAVLSTSDLNDYINTFVLYDLPEQLRLFDLRTTFTFFCNPYQDLYITDATLPITNPLYNFKNLYITVHPPLYISGYEGMYTQSREQFFGIYPKINSILSIGVAGNGATTTYSGFVNQQLNQNPPPTGFSPQTALLQNQVLFDSIDINGAGLAMIDVPVINPATGNPTLNGNLYVPGQTPATPPTSVTPNNTINYSTGKFTVTFPTAPATGAPINSQTVPTVLSIPQAMLFFNNQFVLRPVPDQPYRIQIEVFKRPVELIASNQVPELEEWWQYIAYGAAKKVLEDRMDLDSVALILPEFKKQEAFVLRKTLVQYANQRVATIYTEQTSTGYNGWGWGAGGTGNL